MYLDSKTLKTVIPYTTVFIIVCGFIKESIYYKAFNVRIEDFIDLSEVLTLFLPDILSYALYGGLPLLLMFLIESRSESLRLTERRQAVIAIVGFRRRLWGYLKLLAPLTFMFFILVPLLVFTHLRGDKIEVFPFMMIVMLPFLIILEEFKRKYGMSFGQPLSATYSNIILLCFMIMSFSISKAHRQIHEVKELNKLRYSSFTINGIDYKCNKQKYVVGLSKHYLFFYDSKTHTSKVYQRDQLLALETLIMVGFRWLYLNSPYSY